MPLRRAPSFVCRTLAGMVILSGGVAQAAGPITYAIWTGATSGSWATGSNWDTDQSGVHQPPNIGANAYLQSAPPGTKTIDLGAGAAANYLFVEDAGYQLQNGDLTLGNQLWIQQSGGGSGLTLASSGTITAPGATLGADSGKKGSLWLDATNGPVALAVSGTMQIGAGGGSNSVSFIGSANPATLSAGTIQLGVASTSSNNNLLVGVPQTLTFGTLQVGVDGGSNNVVIEKGATLNVTGASDVAIGMGATSSGNKVMILDAGTSFSGIQNVVVGLNGVGNEFIVNGATAQSGGARLGVDVGANGNFAVVEGGGSWTMGGTVRVGDAGSANSFFIDSGTTTLTAAGKNFFVGYARSASNNMAYLTGAGARLNVKEVGADVVISANVGAGPYATGNTMLVNDGATVDTNTVYVGSGGTLGGDLGVVKGDVLVGTGGVVAPGDSLLGTGIGSLAIQGNLDLAPAGGEAGTLAIGIDGSQIDQISVSGLLDITNATLHFDTTNWDGLTHVFATYGSLAGTFGTIGNAPSGSYIDYLYGGLNQIALVAAVPEIDAAGMASVMALVTGFLGLVERRRQRS